MSIFKPCSKCLFYEVRPIRVLCQYCSRLPRRFRVDDVVSRADNRQLKVTLKQAIRDNARLRAELADALIAAKESKKLRKALGEFIITACPENDTESEEHCEQWTTASGCDDCVERQVQKIMKRGE